MKGAMGGYPSSRLGSGVDQHKAENDGWIVGYRGMSRSALFARVKARMLFDKDNPEDRASVERWTDDPYNTWLNCE